MAKGASLVVLFEAESEPTPKAYKEAVDDTIKNPQQISSLTEETVRDDVLILLTTRSNRLGLYFGQLRAIVRQYPKSSTTSSVAAETVIFLVRMLPSLHQLLDPTEILKFLIPALDICFVPIQRPTLRDLASVLAETGTLLEYVTSDRYGSDILRQWACILGTSVLDTPILESWTERLVTMVGSCMANHDVAQAIQQCGILRSLKNHLRSLEARHSRESFESIAQNELQPLSSMTQLSKDDKKTRHIGEKEPETNFVILDDNTKENLKIFDMPDPKSWSALRNVVERLEGDETSKMHLSVMTHFPCELCIHGLKSSAQIPHARMLNERIEKTPNLQIEIMGEALGVWQILLSMQAMRSFQEMGRQGTLPLSTEGAVVTNTRQVSLNRLKKS